MYSSPRWQWLISAARFDWVPLGKKSAPPRPKSAAVRSCSRSTVGSSPKTSSPTSAAAMAARIAGPGRVTVSLRRAIMRGAEGRGRESVTPGGAPPRRSLRSSALTRRWLRPIARRDPLGPQDADHGLRIADPALAHPIDRGRERNRKGLEELAVVERPALVPEAAREPQLDALRGVGADRVDRRHVAPVGRGVSGLLAELPSRRIERGFPAADLPRGQLDQLAAQGVAVLALHEQLARREERDDRDRARVLDVLAHRLRPR